MPEAYTQRLNLSTITGAVPIFSEGCERCRVQTDSLIGLAQWFGFTICPKADSSPRLED